MVLVLLLVFPLLTNAYVLQDDVTSVGKAEFSLQTFCKKMVTHESPLIDVITATEIDCMGKKVKVDGFCDKEMATDPYYIRAYVDRETKKVICQSGKKVLFKYVCEDGKICGTAARSSCLELKTKLAKRLDLVHSSYVQNDKNQKQLNCFYESLPLKERFNGL